MKKLSLFIALIIFYSINVSAQLDSIKAGWGTLDYSIPESPALKILGSNPDNIIKPTSVRAVAFNVGNYFLTNGPVIPKSLAVEVSPLLLNAKASLKDYNNNKFLYRMRLSVGTNTSSNGSYSIAEGLRFTIMDKTDLRGNNTLNNYFMGHLSRHSNAVQQAIKAYGIKNNLNPGDLFAKLNSDTAFATMINSLALSYLSNDDIDPNALSKFRDSIRNSLWNASIWEVGIAALQSSSDSLIKNLSVSQFGLWSTAGFPVGKKGQLLIGAKLGLVDSVKWQTNVSIGERLYYGGNDFKGFLQAQYDYKNSTNYFTTSLGCQFNITNGVWGEFTINLVLDGSGKLSYQPGFNIGLATPEKKKS